MIPLLNGSDCTVSNLAKPQFSHPCMRRNRCEINIVNIILTPEKVSGAQQVFNVVSFKVL